MLWIKTSTRWLGLAGILLAVTGLRAEAEEDRIYELRSYTTAPDKLPVLLERFGTHNLPLFEKHGITLVGAWTPLDEDEPERLVYLVSFPSREAAGDAWSAFGSDPEWQRVFGEEKETHGTVVTNAVTIFLTPTDYSPTPQPDGDDSDEGRVYELRTYVASPGKFENLHARFRDHTMGLFEKHGINNVVYTTPIDEDKGADNTLFYLVSHESRDAADESWQAFRDDPDWQEVYQASQPDGVRLAAEVIAVYLKPTDFSPLK